MDSVSMYDEDFQVSWDENDQVQVQEDEWISSVIGTEQDAIYDVLAEIQWIARTVTKFVGLDLNQKMGSIHNNK